MDNKKDLLRKDLEKDFEKGDVIQIKGTRRIYIIKGNPENLLKYSPDYFKKRGRKARVSLLIKKGNHKTGGGTLENIFNKREDENMKITIPYKYFHDTMEYFNLIKKNKTTAASTSEERKDAFFSSMDKTKMSLKTEEGSKELDNNEKGFLFNFGAKKEEEPPSQKEEQPQPLSLFGTGEPEKKEGEEEEEPREREIKVVIEGELLEYTREYYEDKRREMKGK